MIGRVFDNRYEILRKIGSGGMADVYLAHDRHLERDVALKILSARYAGDDQFVERFRREASNAAGLSHPNIVQIYDRGEAEGTYYIAMEYLEGRSLKEIIRNYAPLRSRHIVSIAGQILEALRFAHRKGIIHRDIKPQNIMVDDEGRVKVTDFGIARAASASRMTDTGSIVGTAQYLSPEQAQGTLVEAPSDLYSLGVVMYEMATGRLPFDGDNPVAIAMKHVHDAPEPPGFYNDDIPENLERVILRALAKDPAERYADAEDFLADLHRVEHGQAVSPPPAFDEGETRVMGADSAPTMARTSQTMVRPRDAGPYRGRREEPAEPKRRPIWPWLLVVVFVLVLAGAVWALVGGLGEDVTLVDVPNLVGLTLQEAESELEDAGLEMGEVTTVEDSDEYPEAEPGTVVRQDPESGQVQLEQGSTVDVWVLAEEETQEVPDVVGETVQDAAAILGQAGFEFDIERRPSDEFDEDIVVEQSPRAGEVVPAETRIRLIVSSGPEVETVVLEDLRGRTLANASGYLEALGLVVDVVEQASDEPEGRVIAQNPGPNAEVEVGSTVTLTVSSGPAQVEVPGVIGETEEAATNLIRDRGLRVETQPVSDEASPGTVIDQNPAGGDLVERGSTVTIWVSTGPPATTTTVPPTTTTTAAGG